MPELPEVEYTARQLRSTVVGATISEALVFWERAIGYPDLSDFLAGVAGRCIEGVRRRGKFLLLDLKGDLGEGADTSAMATKIDRPLRSGALRFSRKDGEPCRDVPCGCSDCVLTIHRRMTGNMLLLPSGWEIDTSLRETDPVAWSTKGPSFFRDEFPGEMGVSSHCRVCFNLADGRRLLFTDPRKFGRVELWPRECEGRVFVGLGAEPLGVEFTVERLLEALAGRKRAIKQVLLAQDVVAGIGNIYADEALFYAAIHPLRKANSLTPQEVRVLHEGIVAVLTLGIEHGGTSFDDYRDLWGEAGENYNHVRVYNQGGKPCVRCGERIERMVIAQRSAHFCPGCQKLTAE